MPTISNTAFARLITRGYYPNPEDSGPLGPAGPVIRDRRRLLVAAGPQPEPWGPSPEPWVIGIVTRAAISRAADQAQMAGITVVGGDAERAIDTIAAPLRDLVDDLCPLVRTRPPLPPRPWPWGTGLDVDADAIDPAALIVAGAQFQHAADSTDADHPLRQVFADSAQRLFEVGIERMEQATRCDETELAGSATS